MSYQITAPCFENLVDNLAAIGRWAKRRAKWPRALYKAYAYKARHKYRRSEAEVSRSTPLELRTYITETRWDDTDTLFPLPVVADQARNLYTEIRRDRAVAILIQDRRTDSDEQTVMGSDEDPDGANHRTAEPVRPGAGRGYHRRFTRTHRWGGVQRTTERVSARGATLLSLVSADDFAIPVPQL